MFPYVGPPLHGSTVTIPGERGAAPSLAAEVVDDYRAEFESIAVEMAATFPGVSEFLDRLSGRVRLAVVTSKPEVYASPVLDRLGFTEYREFIEWASLAETQQKPETLARNPQHQSSTCGKHPAARYPRSRPHRPQTSKNPEA